jgi:hypothetical protein
MNKLDMNLFAFVAWLEQNRHAHSEDRLTINDGYEWYNYMWNLWLKNSDVGREMMMSEETIKEAAASIAYDSTEANKGFPSMEMFKAGAKWQQERMYSQEEKLNLINFTSNIFELGKSHFNYVLITPEEILELYNETFKEMNNENN